ncbi:NUDIX hydrolase domain-like protein [Haematococcus lacustris]
MSSLPGVEVSQHHGSVQAEADNEQFDTFDAAYTPLGPKQRGEVHAKGIWHQAVHVLVFNSAGQLLLQQRSQGKRVCPGSWDLSCAEHLSQGESFHQAAEYPDIGIRDYEFVQTWQLDAYDGPLCFNAHEVSAVRWSAVEEVCEQQQREPHAFTPWFTAELQRIATSSCNREAIKKP